MLSFMNQFKKLFIFTFVIFSGADRPTWGEGREELVEVKNKIGITFLFSGRIGAPDYRFKGSMGRVQRQSEGLT